MNLKYVPWFSWSAVNVRDIKVKMSHSQFIKHLTRVWLEIRLHQVVDEMVFIDAFHFLSALETAEPANQFNQLIMLCNITHMVSPHWFSFDDFSSQPLTSILGFVCVLQTDTSSSYLAVGSTDTAVGRFWSLVRWSGIRCLTSSEIRRVVLTVVNSFLRQLPLVSTNVTSALQVFI